MRGELDVVAEALVAEEDIERDDAPVGVPLAGLRKIRGRVDDDGRVLRGQVHAPARPAARCRAATIESSSSSFVMISATPTLSSSASSAVLAEPVRQTIPVSGHTSLTARATSALSSPGSR